MRPGQNPEKEGVHPAQRNNASKRAARINRHGKAREMQETAGKVKLQRVGVLSPVPTTISVNCALNTARFSQAGATVVFHSPHSGKQHGRPRSAW